MKFKFWSDTNLINCSARLEDLGIDFETDLLKNIVTVKDRDARAGEIIREEGGQEIR